MRACLFALLLLVSTGALAQSFDSNLREADRVRTTDRTRFFALMSRMDREAEGATPAQRMELRLLHAYEPLLDANTAESISQLQQLIIELKHLLPFFFTVLFLRVPVGDGCFEMIRT